MDRYYFDVRDGDEIIRDEEGYELPSLEAVQREAVLSLADGSRDAAERAIGSLTELAIDVRDASGPVMQVKFSFHLFRAD